MLDEAQREEMRMMEDVDETNNTFNEELDKQIAGELEKGHIYSLGLPSEILRSTGIPNLPIQMNAQKLMDKSSKFGHNYKLEEVKNLVKAIQNPIAIFSYGDAEKAQNIIIEMQHEGKNFLVGLSINPIVGGRHIEINSIRNVFPKNNSEWLNWICEGKLLYADKQRIQDLINKQRTIPADVDYMDLDSVAKILQNFEIPKIQSGENPNLLKIRKENFAQPMFFKTDEGEVYGFTMGGKVYYDPRVATKETMVHEYSHLWAEALRKANPQAWEQLKGELKKDVELMDYVKRKYPELAGREDALMEEVFAHYSGKHGAERMDALCQEKRSSPDELLLFLGKRTKGQKTACHALQKFC